MNLLNFAKNKKSMKRFSELWVYSTVFRRFVMTAFVGGMFVSGMAQDVDYSVVSVPEEAGADFVKVTRSGDYVCLPQVRRSRSGITWLSNRILGLSPQGGSIAYLSYRNNTTNIFIKDLARQGGSTQRTNRLAVLDFSYSPDGKYICFSETRGRNNQIFQTDASSGYVCRQITTGDQDYSPVYSGDMKHLFFARTEANGASIWSFNPQDNFLSSYAAGMNPCPLATEPAFVCARQNAGGRSELWKVNYQTGVEECLLSDPVRSFTSPVVSPDGRWVLFVGDSHIEAPGVSYWNTDLFVCRIDGSGFAQLTYHAADDLSPVWSGDGRYIYFISQRGDADGTANIWRMNFQHN